MDSTSSLSTTSIVGIIVGALMLIFGAIILVKNAVVIRFTRVISGLWFFGYLTLLIGGLAVINSGTASSDSTWIVFGCAIGFALVGAALCYFIAKIGNPVLGASFGWSFWSIFSAYVPVPVANLVLFIVLAIVGAISITLWSDKVEPVAVSWIGATLFISGAVQFIISSLYLSGMDWNALSNATTILYILGTVLTILVFGGSYYFHTYKNCSSRHEKEELATEA